VAISLALVLTAGVLVSVLTSDPPPASAPAPGSTGAAAGLGRGEVVWVDYSNRLHLGMLASLEEEAVGEIGASPLVPLVTVGRHVLFVDTAGRFVPSLGHWSEVVESLDLSTGRVTTVGPGQSVIPSPDGRSLYLAQMDDSTLLEVAVGPGARSRLVTLPPGWYVPSGLSVATGAGLVVQTNDAGALAPGRADAIGLFDPSTDSLRVLGRFSHDWAAVAPDSGILGTFTPAGGHGGLLAWMRPDCRLPSACPVELTNLSDLVTRTVGSPLGFGFAWGGALSPSGRELAVFAHGRPSSGMRRAELALVDTSTGKVRLVPSARVRLGEDVTWALWLPGGRSVLGGDVGQEYAVDTVNLASRPFSLAAGGRRGARTMLDFSAALVEGR